MTPEQIKERIGRLDDWLKSNAGHPDAASVLHDKRELENELKDPQHDKPG